MLFISISYLIIAKNGSVIHLDWIETNQCRPIRVWRIPIIEGIAAGRSHESKPPKAMAAYWTWYAFLFFSRLWNALIHAAGNAPDVLARQGSLACQSVTRTLPGGDDG